LAYAYIQIPGNGTNRLFSVSFPFILRAHVKVYLGYDVATGTGTELVDSTGFTWLSDTQIQTTVAPPTYTTLTIIRKTPNGTQLVTWAPGSPPTPTDLNISDLQSLYAIQEQSDLYQSTVDAAITAAAMALSAANAVSAALPYQPIASVSLIPASPTTGQRIEIGNTTGLGSFSPVAGRPAGFVGGTNLKARMIYGTPVAATWNWVDYSPLDPDGRYADINFTQSGAGAVSQPVAGKLKEMVTVRNFGAAGNGTTDDLAAFNFAANAAPDRSVIVPPGNYFISAATDSAYWILLPGANIIGLAAADAGQNGFMQDQSRLTGNIFAFNSKLPGKHYWPTVTIGATNRWFMKNWKYTSDFAPRLVVSADDNLPGAYFSSYVGPTSGLGFAIGAMFSGVSNDTSAGRKGAWSAYCEGFRGAPVDGTQAGGLINFEMDIVNLGDTQSVTPSNVFNTGITAGLWLSSGGGTSAPLAGTGNDASVAIGIISNPKAYRRGLVVRDGAINTTGALFNEIVASGLNSGWAWYYPQGAGGGVASYLDNYRHERVFNTTTSSFCVKDISRRIKSDGSTGAGWEVYRHLFFSARNSGANEFDGAQMVVRQETNFSGSNARFSYTFEANNDGAGRAGLAINLNLEASVHPLSDNTTVNGTPSFRWSTVYAGTGTIATSDARLKQDISALSAAEKRVALAIMPRIARYRYIDAVEKKGERARVHVGVTAQEVESAFAAEGLNADDYGLFCWDKLSDGSDRYGIRYEELTFFILAAVWDILDRPEFRSV
jgi:hypothetical protein